MKKLFIILISILTIFILSSCDITELFAPVDTDSTETTVEETSEENNEIPSSPDSSKTLYTVEIENSENYPILNELKESYRAGETVTIELEAVTEHYYVLYVNGVEQKPDDSISDDWTVTYYSFTMPDEDVIIIIEDRWVEIPLA